MNVMNLCIFIFFYIDFPIITVKQQNFSDVYTETTVSFELNVTSNTPVESVSWEKSNTSYFFTRSPVNITDDRILGGTIDDPSLTISNVSVADTGYYRFTATNADGPSYMEFLLNVTLRKWIGLSFFEELASMRFFFQWYIKVVKEKTNYHISSHLIYLKLFYFRFTNH